MRVTQEGMVNNTVQRLMGRLEHLEQANARLASGRTVEKASDDPAGMNRILGLRASLRSRAQSERNAADGLTRLNMADTQLQQVVTRVQRARDLTVRAPQMDAPARQAAKAEIEAIRDELLGMANAQLDGRTIFTGFAAPDEAVTFNDADQRWEYHGDDGTIMRRVSEEDKVEVSVTAQEIFGLTEDPEPDSSLFSVLDDVMSKLDQGDSQGLSQSLSDIDIALSRIGDQQAKVGANTNRIESAMTRNSEEALALKGELAQVEDVDLAQAVMELQTQEVAYQATLAALSRVIQPSLVDFIR